MMQKLEDQAKTPAGDVVSAPEPAKSQDPDAKTLKEASKTPGLSPAKGSAENSKENGARVAKNSYDSGGGLAEVVNNANEVVGGTEVLVGDGKIDALGNKEVVLEDSDMNGVSTLLKLQESFKEAGTTTRKGERSDGLPSDEGGGGYTDNDGVSLLVDIRVDKIRDFGNVENGDDINYNGAEDVSENKEGDGEDVDDEDSNFRVGDFVWAKIKNHPWWPGQIYDPSEASDYALRNKQKVKGRILVAYFGDGTFSWCNTSQLIPFEEHFEEMTKQSSSKSFVNAVQEAVDEFGRVVEMKMTCSCVPKKDLVGLERPLAVNAGITEGVYVPEGGIGNLLANLFEPEEYLADMKNIALSASVANLLELAVLKGRLSAFHRSKGSNFLVMYHEPQPISGLEDKIEREGESSDSNNMVEIQIQGPFEDDWHDLPQSPEIGQTSKTLLQNSPVDRPQQKRKQKSIAEIMNAEAENREGDMSKRVKNSGKSSLRGRKKRKDSDEGDGDGISDLKSESSKALKETKLSGSPLTAESEFPIVEIDGSGIREETKKVILSNKRKKTTGSNSASDGVGFKEANSAAMSTARRMKGEARTKRDDGEAKEQTEKSNLSREKKKSKYLSPPYTNIGWRQRKKETEEPLKVPNEAQLAEQVTTPTLKYSSETTQKLSRKPDDDGITETQKQDKDKGIDSIEVKAPASEVLSRIRAAALSPQFVKKNNALDKVGGFLSIFRSSVYSDGSNYKMYNQGQQFRKRKSLESEAGSSNKDDKQADITKSPELESRQTRAKKIGEMKTNVPKLRKKDELNSGQSKLKANEEPRSSKSRKLKINEELKSDESEKLKKNEVPKSDGIKRKKTMIQGSVSASGVKTNDKETEGTESSAVLCATFDAGGSLPSKKDLVQIYSKFGELNEEETDMFYENFCARVVFIRTADAEKALNSCQNASPFGAASLNFCLEHPSAASGTHKPGEIESSTPRPATQSKKGVKSRKKVSASQPSAAELTYIKEKLEVMTKMLEDSGEMKSRLESEMKGLLEKVSAMVGSSSS